MTSQLTSATRAESASPRIFLYGLLVAFNAFLWLLLLAFQWEISLRAREVQYFGRYLFPLHSHVVPLSVIYAACAFLSLTTVAAVVRDRHNHAMRERLQALLGQILESLEIGVLVVDKSGALTLANESARKLLSRMPSKPPGSHFLDLLGDYAEIKGIAGAALEGGNYVREVEHSIGTADDPRAVRATTLPLKDLQKRTIGTLLLVNDVQEVVAMERQMRAAERLSVLGTLAAALAHEIRNPLEALNLNLELLERNLGAPEGTVGQDEKKRKYLGILKSEISRLSGIVENFLSFARPSRKTANRLQLGEVLKGVTDLVANQAKSRNVEMILVADGSPIVVEGSEDQIKQAFLNVIINSLEAMPTGGRLVVSAVSTEPSGSTAATATVRIEDTGEGIPPERMGRLFEPFFSTRAHGTGLGLTIAHRVIQDHGGRIRVESTPGRGTTLTVELPLVPAEGQR
jgi:signal transduction histidine kinase